MGYWRWWWDTNCLWIIIPGIILFILGVSYALIITVIHLADILPKWIQMCIMIGALIIVISLLILASYWKHQDYLEGKNHVDEGRKQDV